MSFAVHADVVEVNGKSLNCELRSKDLYHCLDGKDKVLVTQSDIGFIAIKKGKDNYPLIEVVNKIYNKQRVLYLIYPEKTTYDDSLANRRKVADIVASGLEDYTDPFAKELVLFSKKYLENSEKFNQINILIHPETTPLVCTRGEGRDSQNPCDFFYCEGSDPDEKILALVPSESYSIFETNVLSMKNGQARYFDGDLKILSSKGEVIDDIPGIDYKDTYVDPIQNSWNMNNDLFIPTKYNPSKSSYYYIKNTRLMAAFHEKQMMCNDKKIKALFDQQNQLALDMDAELAKADIIEYLKMINGNVSSFYVDRAKGIELGCVYQNRVLDNEVLDNLSYLKKVSEPTTSKKPLSESEVQELFRKAKNMQDIPFEYKYNGCYARAHVMARRFEEMGIPTQKVWIKGDLYVPGTDIKWNYHVAPVVEVKGKNGLIHKFVIDPSLSDKAVTLDEWVAKMGKLAKGPLVHTKYPPPINTIAFQRTTVSVSSSDAFGPLDLKNMTEAEKMSDALATLRTYKAELEKNKRGVRK